MFHALTSHLPLLSTKEQEEEGGQAAAAAAAADAGAAMTDPQGRTKGLEDPLNPALIDDPLIFSSSIPVVTADSVPAGQVSKDLIDSKGKPFIDPRLYGGSSLDKSTPTAGEPLNVIISALSSPAILTAKGLQNYLRSLDLDFECLGLHAGGPQQAWLDPRGYFDQQFLYREVYTPLDHIFGTCIESLTGGNHIRAWQQMGSGAWFFAASKEENVTEHHMIIPDGYNIGRDFLVQQVQKSPTNQTSFMFKSYQTKVEYISDLLPPGATGVNHGIATDGRVALLTVKLLTKDDKKTLAAKAKETKLAATKTSDKPKKRFSLPVPRAKRTPIAVA